ncbi:MAG TPA: molybdenum cofactor guanylyltransferase [Syntrophomonadaceae bacterium]|nr:molybdenum cofactor guanylyltransferase [Syntrophomonadaceae bacterium]
MEVAALNVSGIVLSGGLSSRMGRDKTLITFNNETLIERVVREISKVADEIIIASNNTCKYGIPGTREVTDTYQGMGPLGGIHAGLMEAKYSLAFVVAADMPMFSADLAKHLLGKAAGYDVVVPEMNGKWEPLCAVYARQCLKCIDKFLRQGKRTVFSIYSELKVLNICDEQLLFLKNGDNVFMNLNTPEDYEEFIERNSLNEVRFLRQGGGNNIN